MTPGTTETFECFDCGEETPRDASVFEKRVYEEEVVVEISPYHRMDPRYNPKTETRPVGEGRVPVCSECSRTEGEA